jgi:membrane dipeptidase
LSYVPTFIDRKNPTLERLLDHVDHIIDIAGVNTVGLGSDFDGGGSLLADATEVPRITEGLISRGYGGADIRSILGNNILRVLRETIR